MLLVMVISVALARSSLDTDSLFSLDIMLPKLKNKKPQGATHDVTLNTWSPPFAAEEGEEEEELTWRPRPSRGDRTSRSLLRRCPAPACPPGCCRPARPFAELLQRWSSPSAGSTGRGRSPHPGCTTTTHGVAGGEIFISSMKTVKTKQNQTNKISTMINRRLISKQQRP